MHMMRWALAATAALGLVATSVSAEAETAFKVGVILPLSGSTAWGGRSAKVAAEMAAQEINDGKLAGDSKVDLVFADGACEPRSSYAAAEKLITSDGVQALIGEWCSSASIAIAQVASDSKIPFIVQISTADGIAKDAGPYVFQSIMQNRDINAREAALLMRTFKFKTAAIIVENNDFGLSFQKNMSAALEKAGIKLLVNLAQDRGDTNWYSTLTRVQSANPDIVVVSISAGQAANFVKQYAESNIKIPLFSDYPPPPYIFEKQVGEQAGKIGLVRGAFFIEHPKETAAQRAFIAKFEPLLEKTIGEKQSTTHWDIVTYDAVMLVADALKRGGPQPDAFVKALAQTRRQGVLGRYEFDRDREEKPGGLDFLFIKNTPDGHLEVLEQEAE
jgi:branched-chain amino acid transport system substrate-binding protein